MLMNRVTALNSYRATKVSTADCRFLGPLLIAILLSLGALQKTRVASTCADVFNFRPSVTSPSRRRIALVRLTRINDETRSSFHNPRRIWSARPAMDAIRTSKVSFRAQAGFSGSGSDALRGSQFFSGAAQARSSLRRQ